MGCTYDTLGCYDGCLYVLNRHDGDIHWCFQVPSRDPVKSSPAVDPDKGWVWFGSHDQHLYCLDVLVGVAAISAECRLIGALRRGRKLYSDCTLGEDRVSPLLVLPLATEFCMQQLWLVLWLLLAW